MNSACTSSCGPGGGRSAERWRAVEYWKTFCCWKGAPTALGAMVPMHHLHLSSHSFLFFSYLFTFFLFFLSFFVSCLLFSFVRSFVRSFVCLFFCLFLSFFPPTLLLLLLLLQLFYSMVITVFRASHVLSHSVVSLVINAVSINVKRGQNASASRPHVGLSK